MGTSEDTHFQSFNIERYRLVERIEIYAWLTWALLTVTNGKNWKKKSLWALVNRAWPLSVSGVHCFVNKKLSNSLSLNLSQKPNFLATTLLWYLVTLLSWASKSTPPFVTFSLTHIKPPGMSPDLHCLKKSTKSSGKQERNQYALITITP